MGTSKTDPLREEVASEPRHWVRISRTCNNRCAFCLDSDVQDGTLLDREEVEREIDRGREMGATRLILSGGEATIHPDFVHFIEYGRTRGYGHVQTITNGRMFAYRKFTDRAVRAGLGEVTFSLHGHTPELADEMTGVPGSFVQTVAGIRNVVGSGIVVSGDVVVNRRNVRHTRDILDLFISLGVREFDILMVVPFGRASPGEGDLLFDLQGEIEHVQRALELSRDPTLHVWTNRMDPRFLEGYEDLIQDPHKLHDEVRGRSDILADLVAGRPMRCQGDRCSHCFIQGLCEQMRAAVQILQDGVPGVLRVDLRREVEPLGGHRDVLWIRARDASHLQDLERFGTHERLWLCLDGLEGAPRADRIIVWRPDQIERALSLASEVLVVLTPETAGRIPDGCLVALRPAATLREEVERGLDVRQALAGTHPRLHVDIPPCLSGCAAVIYEDPFDAHVVRDARIDPDRFVGHYIQWHYRVKSLRCAQCTFDDRCRGISIHMARRAGLCILEPRS